MEVLGDDYEILLQNDLKFESIAKSKVFGKLPYKKREIRKLALSSEI